MSSVLKNVLVFSDLEVDDPVSIAHEINLDGRSVAPDLLIPSTGGYTITADATNVTVTRLEGAAADVGVYCERWHSYERALPLPNQLAGLIPFVGGNGGGGGSGPSTPPILVDPTVNTEPVILAAGFLSVGGTTAEPEQALATLPEANSVPNGTIVGFVNITESGTTWNALCQGADTFYNGGQSESITSRGYYYWISDGESVWWELARFVQA